MVALQMWMQYSLFCRALLCEAKRLGSAGTLYKEAGVLLQAIFILLLCRYSPALSSLRHGEADTI